MTRVFIWEFERGWGSRLDETRTFKTRKAAEQFAARFNAWNNKDQVPDWYMVAIVED
jgi:hypothetical protein